MNIAIEIQLHAKIKKAKGGTQFLYRELYIRW